MAGGSRRSRLGWMHKLIDEEGTSDTMVLTGVMEERTLTLLTKYQSSGLNNWISLELSLPSWDSPTTVSSMSPHYKWLSCRSLTSLLLDCLRYDTSSSEPHNWIPFSVIQ